VHKLIQQHVVVHSREGDEIGMKEAAEGMGIRVKILEDIETVRPYGRHLSIDILVTASNFY
jgi:hypothetical protein